MLIRWYKPRVSISVDEFAMKVKRHANEGVMSQRKQKLTNAKNKLIQFVSARRTLKRGKKYQ